jgi:hypothetical protein
MPTWLPYFYYQLPKDAYPNTTRIGENWSTPKNGSCAEGKKVGVNVSLGLLVLILVVLRGGAGVQLVYGAGVRASLCLVKCPGVDVSPLQLFHMLDRPVHALINVLDFYYFC